MSKDNRTDDGRFGGGVTKILETERGPAFTLQSVLESWGIPAFYVVFIALAVFPPLFYLRQPLLHDEMIYLVVGREIASGERSTLASRTTRHPPSIT
jgi:hypothetical protein